MPRSAKLKTDEVKIEEKRAYEQPKLNIHENTGAIADGDLNDAFKDIDLDKLQSEYEEKHRPKPPILAQKPARILGGCVILFFIAVILVSVFGIRHAVKVNKAETERKNEIATYLSPVVSIGIQPFEKSSEIDAMTRLRCSALYAIENSKEELKQDENGKTVLPVYMMTWALSNLFGDGVELKYYSFDINGSLFEYDAENKCYLFSASGITPIYTPQIESYSEQDGKLTAKVKYISANGEINAYNDMIFEYQIKTGGGENTILSIKKVK